jgi:translation initiation factor 1
MSRKQRLPTDGGQSLTQNPFANLDNAGLPPGPPESAVDASKQPAAAPRKNRGRVDIIRQTAHRGGKTVTVVTGFVGIGLPEKESLAKAMQKACGSGGTVKDGCIEIQGDRRDVAARILTEAGFRPVFAGG